MWSWLKAKGENMKTFPQTQNLKLFVASKKHWSIIITVVFQFQVFLAKQRTKVNLEIKSKKEQFRDKDIWANGKHQEMEKTD